MSTLINALNDAICAATSLTPQQVGVSVGDWSDRATWRARFVNQPTAQQQATADAVIAAFNPAGVVPDDAVDSIEIVALKIAFNHENRIRALEGKAAITLAQFKAALRTLLA